MKPQQPHDYVTYWTITFVWTTYMANRHSNHNTISPTDNKISPMISTNVKVYIACSSVLYLKFLLATCIQGGKKFHSGGRPPEDFGLSLAKTVGKGRKQTYGLDHTDDEKVLKAREVEHRWTCIVNNDLESIPFALFIFGGGLWVDSNSTVHTWAMTIYTIARCAHTFAYAHKMQPHRGICWTVNVVATLVGLGNAVMAIL